MIVKMKFLSLTGPTDDIDRVINTYLSKYEIHLENALLEWSSSKNLKPYVEANPYKEMMARAANLVSLLPDQNISKPLSTNVDTANNTIIKISELIDEQQKEIETLQDKLDAIQSDYDNISPFIDLKYDISSILRFKHINYHFGRIPKEYWAQFEDFANKTPCLLYAKCKSDADYVWCVYFVPSIESDKTDATCTSLHFEETFIPEDSHGTPEKACSELLKISDSIKNQLKTQKQQLTDTLSEHKNSILNAYNRISTAYGNFDVRKLAAKTNADGSTFYIVCGWMSTSDAASLEKEIRDDSKVICIFEDAASHHSQSPPTKLKNPRFFKPFEMLVKMYGLPSYHEFDPTIFVALTYCFIFGIMFGDVGQGLLLVIGGFLLYHFKKVNLAAVISCAGIFSTIFGFMFGSVFGFEDIIEAVWLRPTEHMTNLPFIGSLNTIFIVAIVFGMFIILLSMIFHIINAISAKDKENTFFDTNGIAGFVFYGALVATIFLYMTGHNLPATIILVIMFVIPLILIGFKEPLTRLLEHKKDIIEGSVGMFLTQTFFELFEVLLSYFSNTISFVRIGAFAVSHAAMMQVVMMLAGAESGSPNIAAIIIGNLIVMVMEGFVVGIQVLRLEYYEMFSRYYKGTGREFKPFQNTNV